MRFSLKLAVLTVLILVMIPAFAVPEEGAQEVGFWDYEEYWGDEAAAAPQDEASAALEEESDAPQPADEEDQAETAEEEAARKAAEEAERKAAEEAARIAAEEAERQAAREAERLAALKKELFYQAPRQVTISFAGDCTLGNTPLVRERYYDQSFESYVEQHGMAYPFDKVKEYFLNDDFTVVNLEGVFYNYEANRAKKTYNFRSSTDYVEILTLAGVDAVSIGNNHSLDYGAKGEISTIETLERAKLGWFGINEAADGIYVFEKDGIRIGFTGVYYSFWAKGGKNAEAIKRNLSDLKREKCDLIIACMHCGVEYDQKHDNNQNKMANWLFRYGADMVVGHHPHTVQGLRVENGKTTLWSLGNFVFGGNPSLNYKNPARNKLLNIETFIAQITFSFDEDQRYLGHQINIIPCYTSGTAEYNNYQPVPVTGAEAEKVLSAIQVDSYPLHLKPYVEGVGAVQDFVPAPAK